MTGVSFTSTLGSGVTTTFVTVLDIRWQLGLSIDAQIGYFVDEATFLGGFSPVHKEYVALDISSLVATGDIPDQIFTQLTAVGAILAGGTIV
jgi:hypothetical protein